MQLCNADKLSQRARELLTLAEEGAFGQLVVSGGNDGATRARLAALDGADVLAAPATSADDANALLAGLWLWHDFLEESHAISQGLHSATGSFWHAIMHRREGDFSNTKYWYARCRNHPAYAEIGRRAAVGVSSPGEAGGPEVARVTRTGWDPDAFVDLVAHAHRRPDDPATHDLVRLQRLEWTALFDHCITAATARA